MAVEAARGLSFLHASESKVIYHDFKSSNVLLDTVCVVVYPMVKLRIHRYFYYGLVSYKLSSLFWVFRTTM